MSLNNIETGTIEDTRQLSDSLNSVFEDRLANGIVMREVIVEPESNVPKGDMRKLIDCLKKTNAGPIRILKG
ncbi:MAG: hypothetical protein ACRD43_04975 [Pyrinomonadaceae bacterium]